jgi:purine-binding chemotaxis protein CheW
MPAIFSQPRWQGQSDNCLGPHYLCWCGVTAFHLDAAGGKWLDNKGGDSYCHFAPAGSPEASKGARLESRTLVTRKTRGRTVTPVAREQILLFRVGDGVYGIGLRDLWEVLSPEGITALPTPPYQICTVLAYRGRKLPLIRLGEMFGVSGNSVPPTARVLLMRARGKPFGLLVDEVVEMTEADPGRIAKVPALATLLNPEFFRGIFSRGDRVVLVLDGDGLGRMGEVVSFYGG